MTGALPRQGNDRSGYRRRESVVCNAESGQQRFPAGEASLPQRLERDPV